MHSASKTQSLRAAALAESPRVIWDMTFAARSLTGSRVYAENLYRALAGARGWEFARVDATRVPQKGAGTYQTNARSILWLLHNLERELERARPALFHAAAYLGPRHAPCPMIVNVFDTSYLAFPSQFDWKWRLYARTVIPRTVKNASAILTLSEHSRREIIKGYAISPARVHIVAPGIGAEFQPHADARDIAAARAKYGLSENYLLYVGGRHPRKNVPALLEAFARVRRELPGLQFALVGPRTSDGAFVPPVSAAHFEQGVLELDYVPQTELPLLYCGARAFVYASKLEGFGIPPVEAMACGTPVVCAPNPPMPEVLGDAAYWAQDDSPEALAQAILRVLGDEALANPLRERGMQRARSYTWDNAAQKTLDIYREVLQAARARG